MGIWSSLVTDVYDFGTIKSNPRNGPINCATPHHAAGTAAPLTYAKQHRDGAQQASAHYYIKDYVILGGVSEDRRPWTSGNAANDHRAITFEVSNSSTGGRWPISDKSYESLVKLCADICNRYGFKPHYDGTKNGTITMHKQFQATACPGPYLEELITSHTFENDILHEMGNGSISTTTPLESQLYRVQVGAYKVKENAVRQYQKLKSEGREAIVILINGLYKVQVGAFSNQANANRLAATLKSKGYSVYVTTTQGQMVNI